MIPSTKDKDFQTKLEKPINKLLEYCEKNDWAGYDPYDALNSIIFRALPSLDFRIFRLVLTQALKRSPVNFRPILLVPKTQNPKALALFLMAFLKLRKLGLLKSDDLINFMIQKLIDLRSPLNSINFYPVKYFVEISEADLTGAINTVNQPTNHQINPYWCWGYSFPWQTRTIIVPRGEPNIVCTVFVANALLDAYEKNRNVRYLSMAVSAAEYILNEHY